MIFFWCFLHGPQAFVVPGCCTRDANVKPPLEPPPLDKLRLLDDHPENAWASCMALGDQRAAQAAGGSSVCGNCNHGVLGSMRGHLCGDCKAYRKCAPQACPTYARRAHSCGLCVAQLSAVFYLALFVVIISLIVHWPLDHTAVLFICSLDWSCRR